MITLVDYHDTEAEILLCQAGPEPSAWRDIAETLGSTARDLALDLTGVSGLLTMARYVSGASLVLGSVWDEPGHHWTPRQYFERWINAQRAANKASKEVFEYFKPQDLDAVEKLFAKATSDHTFFSHAYDAWCGVKHSRYSEGVKQLFQYFRAFRKNPISLNEAKEFLEFIKEGKESPTVNKFLRWILNKPEA